MASITAPAIQAAKSGRVVIDLIDGISKAFVPKEKLDAHPESWTEASTSASSRPSGSWNSWLRWA